MDRPEPGLIKWSPLAGHNRFIHINLQHRVVQLYEPNGVAQQGRFDYKQISKHDDFPALTTYDWSPSFPGLLAVGGQNGGVNLLRMDDNSSDYIELGLKMTRMCQAVAFNTQGILAVGLERVRMDQSLHIWDLNRLSMDKVAKGFAKDMAPFTEPVTRLEHSASISSIKFFEDNPQTLVIGLKSQGLRVYDLRDPSTAKLQFSTRCNNNLAIDPDPNYFASSALDQPGVLVWDRRATSRAVASPLRTRRAGTEEPEEGRKTSLLRERRGTNEHDDDEPRFRAPSRAQTEVAQNRAASHHFQTQPPTLDPSSNNSALPRRRIGSSALNPSRLASPSTPSALGGRRYFERSTPDRDGNSVADKLAEERGQRHLSLGQNSLLNRTASFLRRPNRESMANASTSAQTGGYR
ncbi:hypothetical protein BN1708_003619, partial [Verticillium longisporum]